MPISLKYYLIPLVLFFTINSGFAEDIDSLLLHLKNCTQKEKYATLTLLADEYYYSDSLLTSADYYLQAADFELGLSKPNLTNVCEAYGNVGYCYYDANNYNEALEWYEKALQIALKINDTSLISANYLNMGSAYFYEGKYEVSLREYMKALEIDEKLGNEEIIAVDYSVIGKVFASWGKYYKAIEFYKQALEIGKKSNNKKAVAIRLSSIGASYLELHKCDTALQYFTEAYKIDSALENYCKVIIRLEKIANVYRDIKDYNNAEKTYNKALRLLDKYKNARTRAFLLHNLGKNQLLAKKYTEAANYLKRSNKIAEELGLTQTIINNLAALTELYRQLGDFEKAFGYYKKHVTLKDSIFSAESQKVISDFQVKYETEKKEQENKILITENAYNEIQLTKSRHTLFLAVIITILLLILFIKQYRQHLNRKAINAVLNEKNQQLNQLVSTKDRFISIIAHDLKNPFSAFVNISSALNNKFEKMRPEESKELISTLHDSSLKMKELLHGLLEWAQMQKDTKSLYIEQVNLKDTMITAIELSKEMATAKEINIVNKLDEKIEVDASKNGLLTISNNLISNAIKFSPKKSEIIIYAKINVSNVEVSIEDKGIGISKDDIEKLFKIEEDTRKIGESDEKGTGMGLILCKELINKMDGNINVKSVKSQGSTFIFSLPLSKVI